MRLFIVFIFLSNFGFAQKQSGTIYYKKKVKAKEFKNKSNSNMHSMIVEASSKVVFKLQFKNTITLFQKEKKVFGDRKTEVLSKLGSAGFDGKTYINHKDSLLLAQRHVGGETFLVNYPYPYVSWTLVNETKKIGRYECYMAIGSYKNKKSDKAKKVTAWYAPGISLPYGPHFYSGLPGLIIQLDEGYNIFNLEKITFDSNQSEIKKPQKGIKITSNQYHKKVREMLGERLGKN